MALPAPRYSIVLPVRNGGSYVKECVRSILAQTLPDFTFHVLDNASTDGTPEWIASLNDPRIRILPAERSLTIEENWARVAQLPKNEFVTLIGHDDILDPDFLAVTDRLIAKHPGASLYQTHFRYIDAQGGRIRGCRPMAGRMEPEEFLSFFLCNMIDSMGTGYMMRSAEYDAIGGIPMYPSLLFADFELWLSLARKSYFATAPEECFAFRLHQSTTTTSPDTKFQDAFRRFVAYLVSLKAEPRFAEPLRRYGAGFLAFYTKGLAHRLLRTPREKREGRTVSLLLEECRRYGAELVPGQPFDPESVFSVKLARQIDSNAVTRALFLQFKKWYPKPVL